MLRKIRIALAIVCFVAATLLFLDFTGVLRHYLGWIAKIQLLPAVLAVNVVVVGVFLLFTILFGRTYCSVICPMGVMQDIFSHLGGKVKKNRFHYTKGLPWLRAAVLVVFVLLMVLGLNSIAVLIAPYSAYGRIASNLFQPVYMWINNLCAYFAERAECYTFYSVDVWVKSGVVLAVAAVTLVVIGFMSFRWGRLWCNTICPVGTVLGFVSKFAFYRPVIDTSKCNGCGKCAKNCKSMCIDPKEHTVDMSRCVSCMDCIENCSQHAIQFRRGKPVVNTETVDGSRRKFMAATAATAATMAVSAQEKKVDGGLAVLVDKQLPERKVSLKPAGSVSQKHFSARCTACQLCVSVCPQHVLRPSQNLTTLMQPEMGFERGFCPVDCTKCSDACPTGAIKTVTPALKSAIRIGHAVTVPGNCLLAQGVECNACSRHCPSAAISLVSDEATGHSRVAVNEMRCIGCGACEYYCPVRPFSAIYVEGYEVHAEG